MLQTRGAAYGAWSILDALLAATGPSTPFIFKEPLGQAREVKVALSGLFGRFVARAYLERYLNLSIFAHLTSPMSWIMFASWQDSSCAIGGDQRGGPHPVQLHRGWRMEPIRW